MHPLPKRYKAGLYFHQEHGLYIVFVYEYEDLYIIQFFSQKRLALLPIIRHQYQRTT